MLHQETLCYQQTCKEALAESAEPDEYQCLRDLDSFAIEEGGVIHSGNNDLGKSDNLVVEVEYDQTHDPDFTDEAEPALADNDDNKRDYIALETSKFTGRSYSYDELEKMADGADLSVKKYCELYDIVPVDSLMNDKLKASERVAGQVEITNPDLRAAEARLLKDAIDIASCMETPSGSESMLQDLEKIVLRSIRLGSIHSDSRPDEQETAKIKEFKKTFCGSENVANRCECRKMLEDYLKKK